MAPLVVPSLAECGPVRVHRSGNDEFHGFVQCAVVARGLATIGSASGTQAPPERGALRLLVFTIIVDDGKILAKCQFPVILINANKNEVFIAKVGGAW